MSVIVSHLMFPPMKTSLKSSLVNSYLPIRSYELNHVIKLNLRKFILAVKTLLDVIKVFFNWDSLHARLNNHNKRRSYNKKKHKKIKAYWKSV